MALLTMDNPTLLDVARQPGMGSMGEVVNLLQQFNPVLEDATALPCNKGLFHETHQKIGLPNVTWARYYKGTPTSTGKKQLLKDTPGQLETACEVDKRIIDVAEKAEEKASLRVSESLDHYEALSQRAARAIFYQNSEAAPDTMLGLAPRYNDATSNAENRKQIFDGGGTGNALSSIWMITWGRQTAHLIYPKHGKAGIQTEDMGVIPKQDDSGNTYFAYRENYMWHLGLCIRDWRYVTRVANINTSDLTTDATAGANIIELLTHAFYQHNGRRRPMGKTCIYMGTDLVKYLDFQARDGQKNLFLTIDKQGPNAMPVLSFRGFPVREVDALNMQSESAVSFA